MFEKMLQYRRDHHQLLLWASQTLKILLPWQLERKIIACHSLDLFLSIFIDFFRLVFIIE
jgi:hypothetical protein